MKKLYILFITIFITSLSFGQNIALNGGFENWSGGVPSSWSVVDFSTSDLTQSTVQFSEGSYSAAVNLQTQTQANTDIRQTVTLESGKSYTVSLDVYATDNQATVRIFDAAFSSGHTVYSDDTMLNQWQTISFEYTATATGSIEFGMRFYDTSANWLGTGSLFYVDNFKIFDNATASVVKNQIDGFAMYPNPVANGRFSISSNSSADKLVEIYSLLGKQVYSKNVKANQTIEVANLNKGIYILRVEEDGKRATRKLVIQ